MLTYHPAFDSHHCAFRILLILKELDKEAFSVDLIKILDFYLCVPSALSRFRYLKTSSRNKKWGKRFEGVYSKSDNYKQLFCEIGDIQDAVIEHLASIAILNQASLKNGEVLLSSMEEIEKLFEHRRHGVNQEVFKFLTEELVRIPLLGKDGLKHRSGLMDYRYDIF